MTSVRKADALSRETEFSGLPKAMRVWRNSANGFTNGLWNNCYFDKPETLGVSAWNFGGFTYDDFVGNVFSKIIVPEPGVYTAMAQISVNTAAAGQSIYAGIWVNGVQSIDPVAGAPTAQPGNFAPTAAGFQAYQIHAPMLLRAGDFVQLKAFAIGGGLTDVVGFTWIYIQKQGGQY